MEHEVRDATVGGVAFIVLIALSVLAFSGTSNRAPAGYTVNAVFNQIDGLSIGDSVRLAGIEVGRVAAMRLGDSHRAVVALRLAPEVKLPTDSSAEIHSDGLFGGKHVRMEPGGDEKNLGEGDTITITQDSVMMQDLLNLIIGEAESKKAKNAKSAAPGAR